MVTKDHWSNRNIDEQKERSDENRETSAEF
jgi:hypothetical protein